MATPIEAPTNKRVLVIEDEPQMLAELAVVLAANGYRADVAENGQEGLAAAARCRPDAIIVDLPLPDQCGIEVIRGLRGRTRNPLIVLSGSTAGADKVTALDAGADDYVAKPFDAAELLARLRAAMRRADQVRAAARVRISCRIVDIGRRTVTGPQGDVSLTPTEWKVLEVLIRRPGRLVSMAELLAKVPGRAHVPGSSYLRGHLLHLRRKLEINPTAPRHLLTEPGMGFRFRP